MPILESLVATSAKVVLTAAAFIPGLIFWVIIEDGIGHLVGSGLDRLARRLGAFFQKTSAGQPDAMLEDLVSVVLNSQTLAGKLNGIFGIVKTAQMNRYPLSIRLISQLAAVEVLALSLIVHDSRLRPEHAVGHALVAVSLLALALDPVVEAWRPTYQRVISWLLPPFGCIALFALTRGVSFGLLDPNLGIAIVAGSLLAARLPFAAPPIRRIGWIGAAAGLFQISGVDLFIAFDRQAAEDFDASSPRGLAASAAVLLVTAIVFLWALLRDPGPMIHGAAQQDDPKAPFRT